MAQNSHHNIIIIGGGTAGTTVAARLARAGLGSNVAIIEPSVDHYYQPLWTLVGAGLFKLSDTRKNTKDYIPPGVTWIKDAVTAVSGEKKSIEMKSGRTVTCDWMVVASGVELNWDGIKGAKEAMSAPNVSSIYSKDYAEKTFTMLGGVTSGNLLFVFPQPPVKCAGAPQKIMYLADEMLRRNGVRDACEIHYRSALDMIFGVPVFANVLSKVVKRKKIHTHFNQKIIEVRSSENKAIFADTATGVLLPEVSYDYLHLVPPMKPHGFILASDLCGSEGAALGWVDVDPFTLRHKRWPHVFSLGDVCSAPTAKTGAAIRMQAPVVVSHLLADMKNSNTDARYDGYASCPLVTGFGKVVLAEFGYDGKLMPSFPMNAAKESRLMWWFKTIILPRLYWHLMLRGRA